MNIQTLEIENFLSYYAPAPMLFGKGPTIIIGQNRTGKSKLFDAIHWAFYDKAYNTDFERWEYTRDWKDLLVNNYAKSLSKIGTAIKASVIVKFEDEDGNKYTLCREYKIKKKNGAEWDTPRTSSLNLNRRDKLTNNSTDDWDNEAEDIIKSIFPENLSKYFLFQGENISQIMSLSNKSAFTKALTDLSRIEIFEKAKMYSEKVYKTLKKEFEAKEDTDKQLQQRKMQLSGEIEVHKQALKEEEEQFENFVKERDTAKDVFDKKNEELKKYRECAKILNEIEQLEEHKSNKIELRGSLVDSQKRDIFESWMYAGTEILMKNFLAIYEKNKIARKIPEPIRQEFIREMIEKHECLVCGENAEEGSPNLTKIKSFLNEKALDKETELINKLSFVAENTIDKTLRIKSEILFFYKRINDVDEQIKTFNQRIKVKEDELKLVKPADVTDDDLKLKNFSLLQKDRDQAKADHDRFETRISGTRSKIEYINKQLAEKQKEYDSLVANSSNIKEKERLQLAEKIQDTVTKFYDNFLARLISDIEIEANEYFLKMTEKNKSLSGKVKVDYDLKEVYTIDESGNRLFNINQANKVSLQISFVAAVLSVSNKFWNTYFPFIADAPISALGGNNKITTIDTMIDIFQQSIIILKDDAITTDVESVRTDQVRALILNNPNIEHAYELKMQGNSLEEQHTKIEKLK